MIDPEALFAGLKYQTPPPVKTCQPLSTLSTAVYGSISGSFSFDAEHWLFTVLLLEDQTDTELMGCTFR